MSPAHLLSVLLTAAAAPASAPTATVSVPSVAAAPALVKEGDLAPVLASGAAAEGKAAFDAGRYEEAAARLARSALPEAAYVRGLALLEAHRAGDALRALDGLEAKLPDLADRIRFLRGNALAELGRKREAIDAWRSVPDGSLVAPEARLARARAAAALGDREAALAAVEPLLSQDPPTDLSRPDFAATALLLAGRLRAGGAAPDAAGARKALVECWVAHPLAPEADDCRAALRGLPGSGSESPGPEDVLRRAEALLDQNRNGGAIALAEPLVRTLPEAGPDEPFACRARSVLGRAYRKERRYASAIELLRPVADRCEDPGLRVRTLYVLASAVSIAGDKDEAVAIYQRLAREFPGHPLADDALFFAADLLARNGHPAEARDALAALAREYPSGDYRNEARFRLAWLAKQRGDLDAAVAQLLAIEEEQRDQDPYEHGRAAYWRARLLATRGEQGRRAARAVWADLVARYPADYYGLLSRARLSEDAGHDGDGLPPPLEVPPVAAARYDAGTLREDAHFRSGLALLRMGLYHSASEELQAVDRSRLRGPVVDAPEPVLLVADLLDRAGDHRAAHQLLRTQARVALRRAPEGENLRVWRIAYPPAYRDDVRRWAPPAGVPIDLLQALMREESALDPRIVSPAGAVGLTQLMLPTAQSVARQLQLRRPSRGDLMKASLNIRLGARYLGELIRRFDGSVALALAAYNAGGGAVSRWLDARPGLELDEFVEEIPIEETRGYVKRVLRSFAAYRLLYGVPTREATGPLTKIPIRRKI